MIYFFCTHKHTVFCCEIEIVVIYALFSDNKCPLFTRLGGGSPKADIVRFFYRFDFRMASLSSGRTLTARGMTSGICLVQTSKKTI